MAMQGSLTVCAAGERPGAARRDTDEVEIELLKRNRRFPQIRRRFLVALWQELRVVWPIASGLVALQLVLGALVSLLQAWPLGDAFYFTFVTVLTIGYGDLVPKGFLPRLIAIVIGFTGILLTGLVAAVGVRALQLATAGSAKSSGAKSGRKEGQQRGELSRLAEVALVPWTPAYLCSRSSRMSKSR